MWRVIIAAVALVTGQFSVAEDITYLHRDLQWGEGYLLLDLLLERGVSEVTLRPDAQRKSGFKNPLRTEVKLGPYEAGRHLALIPLIKGSYVWSGTAVPHFDLPFRSSTLNDRRWRFTIVPGRINYVGQLVVRKERSSAAVSVDLLTRIAATRETLEELFKSELKLFPIRYAGHFRDQFFETYYEEPEVPTK